jgi:hypothetical protein
VHHIEGEARGIRADQRAEADAGIKEADNAGDVAAAEIIRRRILVDTPARLFAIEARRRDAKIGVNRAVTRNKGY